MLPKFLFGKRDLITFFYRDGYNSVAIREENAISFNPFFEEDKKEQEAFAATIDKHRGELQKIKAEENIISLASQIQGLIANINQAGINVTSDKHLNLLFGLRQQARKVGFNRIVSAIQQTIGEDEPSIAPATSEKLLEIAEEFTGDREKIEMLRDLKKKLSN